MEEDFTIEQQYALRRLRIEMKELSRAELMEALLECSEDLYRQKQFFLQISHEAGFTFRLEDKIPALVPTSEEDFEKVFGYKPTPEEKATYVNGLYEDATMELDMDEIVLDSED